MDRDLVLILFYFISLVLSVQVYIETSDKWYKLVGLLFGITFLYFVLSYLGLLTRGGYEIISIPIAFVLTTIRTIKLNNISLLDCVIFLMLPTATVAVLGFKVLHLNGWNEIRLLSILILLLTIGYLTITYIRKRTLEKIQTETELLDYSLLFLCRC